MFCFPARLVYAIGLLLIAFSISAQAAPTARLDRSVIALEDTFTLTVRVDEAGSITAPDLSPLDQDFQVLGNSQSSRHMIRNGQSESWTEWTITLIAKRKGQLSIPPLTVQGQQTPPLSITVQANVPRATDYLQPVYLESEVDKNSVYVQQQLILTLRIFQSIQLDNMNISEPEFDHAAIEKLGQTSFQRRIQNTPYRVHELRYAIFPQQSGELIIPELVFTASETMPRRSAFSLPGQGKLIRKMSQQHSITVQAPPSSYTGQLWLPANAISLADSWSSDPGTVRVGDSITRSVTLKADGLLDSQLPPIDFTELENAKLYPDQGTTETTITDRGVLATRIDSVAIIPTRTGVIELPEVKLDWWDTNSQQMQQAVLPPRRLTVLPALGQNAGNSTPLAIDHSGTAAASAGTDQSPAPSSFWPWLSALLAGGWLITLYGLWRVQRQQRPAGTAAVPAPSSLSEKQAFKQLGKACSGQDLAAIRQALINWGQCYWHNDKLHSLQAIERCCPPGLAKSIAELDQAMYSPQGEAWQSDKLLAAIEQLRASSSAKPPTEAALPPLYSS